MLLLILGLILWASAHLFKRELPQLHDSLGQSARGIVAVVVVFSLVLMIIGYRSADFIYVWSPPSFFGHINNLLMLIAFFVFGMSATTGRLRGRLRHPMLISVKIWALAHLLVNGDLASIILFGGMMAWAVAEMVMINRAEPWDRPEPGEARKDVLLVAITLVTFAITAGVHTWIGHPPFGGV